MDVTIFVVSTKGHQDSQDAVAQFNNPGDMLCYLNGSAFVAEHNNNCI